MAKRGKKAAAKAEAAKAEAAKAEKAAKAAKDEKSVTSSNASKDDRAASRFERDDRDDKRQPGDGRDGAGRHDGRDDAEAFEFVVTVLQCDGLRKAGKFGKAGVYVKLSANKASGQSTTVPHDGGRPQWNKGRGCATEALQHSCEVYVDVMWLMAVLNL